MVHKMAIVFFSQHLFVIFWGIFLDTIRQPDHSEEIYIISV